MQPNQFRRNHSEAAPSRHQIPRKPVKVLTLPANTFSTAHSLNHNNTLTNDLQTQGPLSFGRTGANSNSVNHQNYTVDPLVNPNTTTIITTNDVNAVTNPLNFNFEGYQQVPPTESENPLKSSISLPIDSKGNDIHNQRMPSSQSFGHVPNSQLTRSRTSIAWSHSSYIQANGHDHDSYLDEYVVFFPFFSFLLYFSYFPGINNVYFVKALLFPIDTCCCH